MPGKEAQEAPKLLFINAGERGGKKAGRESGGLSGAVIVLTVNTARVQTSTGARYTALEEMNYTGPSRVRN